MNTSPPSVEKFPEYHISRSSENSWPDFYTYVGLKQKFLMRLEHFTEKMTRSLQTHAYINKHLKNQNLNLIILKVFVGTHLKLILNQSH